MVMAMILGLSSLSYSTMFLHIRASTFACTPRLHRKLLRQRTSHLQVFHTRAHAQIISTGFPARNLRSTALHTEFAEKIPPRLFARSAREWPKASSL